MAKRKSFLQKFKFLGKKSKQRYLILPLLFLVLVSFTLGVYIGQVSINNSKKSLVDKSSGIDLTKLQEEVIPQKGYDIKIHWGNLGKRMIEDGVIDETKLAKAVTGSDKLPEDLKKYLNGEDIKKITLNQNNAQFWVDVLWGLGLANKNEILDKGPMQEGGNTANFASTGGYTIGVKAPMEFYSKFFYIQLSEKQQKFVREIAENVYRPCCGNSTAFPDCNHGMAALGLIELMVSQNKSKEEIYKTILAFNSYWFPQTYLDISYHFVKNGRNYGDVNPQEILSKTFSSAMGYDVIRKKVGKLEWPILGSGGRCGA
ncbi:MAG: hypothetical protein HYT08_03760 [Candidatus Levybacteria bacterium]|nr:hypothetical protein [Candidatus Levybacteria bacterium]